MGNLEDFSTQPNYIGAFGGTVGQDFGSVENLYIIY